MKWRIFSEYYIFFCGVQLREFSKLFQSNWIDSLFIILIELKVCVVLMYVFFVEGIHNSDIHSRLICIMWQFFLNFVSKHSLMTQYTLHIVFLTGNHNSSSVQLHFPLDKHDNKQELKWKEMGNFFFSLFSKHRMLPLLIEIYTIRYCFHFSRHSSSWNLFERLEK